MKPTFALKDGRPVHISDIPDDERGLKCGCICSACGRRLMAKKGNKNAHHFAHYNGGECSLETIIHNTAKSIIMEAGEILIPATRYKYKEVINYYVPRQVIPLTNIQDEKCVGNIQPDIVCYFKGKPLLIEVYVTHKVDNKKLQKIKAKNVSAIEIDLSDIGYDTDLKELKQLVLYETSNRKWLNNERINVIHNRLLSSCDIKPITSITHQEGIDMDVISYVETMVKNNWKRTDLPLKEKVTKYVFDCPLNKGCLKGRSAANLIKDCKKCEYIIHIDYHENTVACNGRRKR